MGGFPIFPRRMCEERNSSPTYAFEIFFLTLQTTRKSRALHFPSSLSEWDNPRAYAPMLNSGWAWMRERERERERLSRLRRKLDLAGPLERA